MGLWGQDWGYGAKIGTPGAKVRASEAKIGGSGAKIGGSVAKIKASVAMFEVSVVKNGTKARIGSLGSISGHLGPRFKKRLTMDKNVGHTRQRIFI